MKRLPLCTAAAAMLLALAGCGPTTTPSSDAAGHPSVAVATRSVVSSGPSTSPTASPSARPTAPPTHPHTAAPTHTSGSTRRSGTSGGSSTGGSSTGGTSTGGSTTGGGGSGGATVIKSPSGNYYHAGEFCPHADDGLSTVDSHGNRIICSEVNGYYRWHY